MRTLKNLPKSFTFGEVSVVGQAFVLFLLNAGLRLFGHSTYNADHDTEDVTLILQVKFDGSLHENFNFSVVNLQVGLIGVTIIVAVTHFINLFKNDLWFYVLVATVSLSVSLFPVKEYPAVVELFSTMFADNQRVRKIDSINESNARH